MMTSDDITTAIFQAPIPFLNSTQQQACHQVIASLSQQQIEQAACTSYAYYAADKSTFSHHDVRTHMALRMARRHLIQHRGNVELATAAMKDTLEFRERMEINALREQYCKTQKDIRDHPMVKTVAVCGYDVDNRAILVRYPERFSSPSDEASIQLILYKMERALACTERKSLGKEEKIIVAVDYNRYSSRNTPPFHLLKSIVSIFQHHYPERLHMFISVDPPLLVRTIKNMIWPFLDYALKEIVFFVSGEKEKEERLGQLIYEDQAMTFLRKNGKITSWNTEDYLQSIPFDHAANEKLP